MKRNNFLRRKKKVRAKISGTEKRPRLSVYRSSRYIYAQIVDDSKGKTLVAASNLSKELQKTSKVEQAKKVGAEIAKAALAKKIKKVVFDKSGYKYHGRLKALADGAREGGLEF